MFVVGYRIACTINSIQCALASNGLVASKFIACKCDNVDYIDFSGIMFPQAWPLAPSKIFPILLLRVG